MNNNLKKFITFAVAVLFAATAFSCNKEGTDPEKKEEKKVTVLVCGNSMLYYGGIVQYGSQKSLDEGMLFQMLKTAGIKANIFDCTYGGHHLMDFSASGCKYSDKHGEDGKKSSGGCPGLGTDLIGGVNLKSLDYIVISEAGNNYSSFYDDAKALFLRATKVNPNVKLMYVNHIYSVYKSHTNVTGKLKTLHDSLGVTIINCGQLAYDIYKGNVSVPGGSLSYSDRYTFCNHTESDTYHPNPLMGYIMTSMVYCAITGEKMDNKPYYALLQNCKYASGSVSFDSYYSKYYTTPAALPFTTVVNNSAEMKGIQKLIPQYIDKY